MMFLTLLSQHIQLNVCVTVDPPAPPRGRRLLELEA